MANQVVVIDPQSIRADKDHTVAVAVTVVSLLLVLLLLSLLLLLLCCCCAVGVVGVVGAVVGGGLFSATVSRGCGSASSYGKEAITQSYQHKFHFLRSCTSLR